MYRTLKIFLLALLTLNGFAQSDNPFDIRVKGKTAMHSKHQKTKPKPVQTQQVAKPTQTRKKAIKTPSTNPFEKGHRREKVAPKPANTTPGTTSGVKRIKPLDTNKVLGIPGQRKGNDYMFWVLTFVLLILSITINLNRSVLGIIYRAVTNESYLNNLALSSNAKTKVILNLYHILYLINAGIFLYLTIRTWKGWTGLPLLFQCIGFVFVIYAVYFAALHLLKWIYPLKKEITLYVFNIKIFESALGLLLLILNFSIAFSPIEIVNVLIKLGIGLFVITYN